LANRKIIVSVIIGVLIISTVSAVFLMKGGNMSGEGMVYTIRGDLVVRTLGIMSISVSHSNPPCGQIFLTLDYLPSGYVEGDSVVITGTISGSTLHVISISK
jgi:hypothetical protein